MTTRIISPVLVDGLSQGQALDLMGRVDSVLETWVRLQRYNRTLPVGPLDCAVNVELIIPRIIPAK